MLISDSPKIFLPPANFEKFMKKKAIYTSGIPTLLEWSRYATDANVSQNNEWHDGMENRRTFKTMKKQWIIPITWP
jgi:hypothetical protein